MQMVEYTLDDQPIIFNKYEEVSLIFTNYCSFKKEAVVSGYHYGHCTLSYICAGS